MAHAQLQGQAHSQGYRDPRVSFLLVPGDVLVQCPYDKVHWVLEPKFTAHLSKCRRNFMNAVQCGKAVMTPDKDFVVCPFHFHHHVPRAELEEHKTSCPNNPETDKILEKIAQGEKEKFDNHFSSCEGKNEVKPDYRGTLPGGFGDAGAGPYGDSKNSAAGFWGKQDIDRQAKEYDDDDDIGFLKKEQKKRTRYVNGRKVEIPTSEPMNQRLLTVAQMNDPHHNWEIPQKKTPSVTAVKEEEGDDDKNHRFLTYDPVANIDKKKGCMITNPQGLTKSERKAYRDDVVKNISQQMTSEYVIRCEKRGVSTGRFIRSPSGELREVKEEAEEEESEEEEEERPVTPITRRIGWRYNPRRTAAPGYELRLDMQSLPDEDDVK